MFGFLKKKINEFALKLTKKAEEKIEASSLEQVNEAEPRSNEPKSSKKQNEEKPKKEAKTSPKKEEATSKKQILTKAQKPEKKKLGFFTKLKRAVMPEISLSETELESFMWDFELALLEADVAQPVAEQIITELKHRLSAKKFSRNHDIQAEISNEVRAALESIISVPGFDLIARAKQAEKPFVIMFLGPNGAGKTTTLAKIAYMMQANGLSVMFAASDTFRAASIEQLQHHADKLGVRVIKHGYGADPAAVAFDAVNSAKAKGIDCVLIDTAGRQETNKNLMQELKKIKRVVKPQLLIYLDEAIAGNVLLERVEQFKTEVGVDGVILSKMDMDAKGGGVISIARATGVPVIYYGVGQSYEDLKLFSARELLNRMFG